MSGARKGPADGDAGPDDGAAFEQAMAGVRPLDRRTGRALVAAPDPAPVRRTRPPAAPEPTTAGRLAVVERWGETFALLAPGVDRRTLRELRAGERRPQAQLDLHGLTVERALAALVAFVARARGEGRRSALVIHGRGRRSGPDGPVLRERVVDALVDGPLATAVLAAVTAPPALGGPGAALLLLRRP